MLLTAQAWKWKFHYIFTQITKKKSSLLMSPIRMYCIILIVMGRYEYSFDSIAAQYVTHTTHGTFFRFTQFLYFFLISCLKFKFILKECKYFRLFPFANRMSERWCERWMRWIHFSNIVEIKFYSEKACTWNIFLLCKRNDVDRHHSKSHWKKIHSSFLIPSFELIISHIRHHLIRNTISICCCCCLSKCITNDDFFCGIYYATLTHKKKWKSWKFDTKLKFLSMRHIFFCVFFC